MRQGAFTRNGVSRRRFLKICAAGAAGLALPGTAIATPSLHRWSGVALGAKAEINLQLEDAARAKRLFGLIEAEVRRLERIFSLYRQDSELFRLNGTGKLEAPSLEMVELLGLSQRLHRVTGGAFDPTVQPLWDHYARRAVGKAAASDFETAKERTGLGGVSVEAAEIRYLKPGMAMTLNGIAQGFITDRITALLVAEGCTDMVVDLGEVAGRGTPEDTGNFEAGWPVTLRPDANHPEGKVRISLKDKAVASSARLGTTFDQGGTRSHILDPRSGLPVRGGLTGASVVASSAALADGLSTAALVCGEEKLNAVLAGMPDTSAFIVRSNGTWGWLNG